jgi:outer membrane protein assembly factor BamB
VFGALITTALSAAAIAGCRDSAVTNGGSTGPGAERVAWRVNIVSPPSGGMIATDADRVYVYESGTSMVAIGLRDQRVKWRLGTYESNFDSPLRGIVLCGGRVVFGSFSALYGAVPSTGELAWRAQPSLNGSLQRGAPVCAESTVFVGSGEQLRVYAFDARSGSEKWAVDLNPTSGARGFVFTPSVSDGVVVACTREFSTPFAGMVIGLDATSGRELWRYRWLPLAPTVDAGCAKPTASGAGLALASVDDGRVFAFDLRSGAVRWTHPPVEGYLTPFEERPIAITDGVVMVGSLSGILSGVELSTGRQLWRIGSIAAADQTNIIDPLVGDQHQFVGINESGWALAIDAQSGRREWTVQRGKQLNERALFASGVLTPDLFIAIGSDAIYALRRF